jgi:hypothetical protein
MIIIGNIEKSPISGLAGIGSPPLTPASAKITGRFKKFIGSLSFLVLRFYIISFLI